MVVLFICLLCRNMSNDLCRIFIVDVEVDKRREGIVMKKAYINSPVLETAASDYVIKVVYDDGEVLEKQVTGYSYSDIFDLIKENHEDERDIRRNHNGTH